MEENYVPTPSNPTERDLDRNSWQYKLCLRLIVGAFADLLGHKEKEIAKRSGMSSSYFSTTLGHGTLTREKFTDLSEALKGLIDEHRLSKTQDRDRVAAAELLIKGGLDERVQVLMSLLGTPTHASQFPASSDPHWVMRTLAAIIPAYIRSPEAKLNDDQVYRLLNGVFPELTAKQLGFAFHLVGDSILSLGANSPETRQFAARHFERAIVHHGSSILDSHLQLLRCFVWRLRHEDLEPVVRDELSNEILRIVAVCEALGGMFSVPFHLLADEFKAVAEYFVEADPENIVLLRREFSRALGLFDRSIEFHLAGQQYGRDNYDLAHLYHNKGFCHFMMRDYARAIGPFETAIQYYLDLNSAERTAYNFKWLAKTFLELGDHLWAIWCIRASTAIYNWPNTSDNVADIEGAATIRTIVEAKCKDKKLLKTYPESGCLDFLVKEYFYKRGNRSGVSPSIGASID